MVMGEVAKSAVRAVVRRLAPATSRIDQMLQPVSPIFGMERGRSLDRFYIDRFIERCAGDIKGRALEVADTEFLDRYRDRIDAVDVLHVVEGSPGATLIGDLTKPETIPAGLFDCFVCTQTLPFLPDPAAALISSAKLLKPGGVLLATAAGISQISRFDMDRWGDFWRFTSRSMTMLAERAFPGGVVEVIVYGNVFAAKAVLDGLAVEDLPDAGLLDHNDPDYQVIIGLRAVKATTC